MSTQFKCLEFPGLLFYKMFLLHLALSFAVCASFSSTTTASNSTIGTVINSNAMGLHKLNPILPNNTFDYVIVGAGTAGLALAQRLSQDGNSTVAVLEAGHDVATDLTSDVLSDTPGGDVLGCGADDSDFAQNKIDWKIRTTPQVGCNGRSVRYARGKTTGGSSARNFMIYQRPPADSQKSWQNLTGDSSWGYWEREQDYRRTVTYTPPRQDLRQDDPPIPITASDYGSDDPVSACVQISYPNQPQEFSHYMMQATDQLNITRSRSFTDGTRLDGIQFVATTIDPKNGHRSTSRCFYELMAKRPNFEIFFKSHAKSIVLTRGDNGKPKARGVTYSTNLEGVGTTNVVFARKEVIVSAGVFQSPQLLMVSGIGPRDQLQQFNITPVVINPHVGRNLQDHVFAGPSYRIDPKIKTLTKLANEPVYLAQQLALYLQQPPRGIWTNNVADTIGFETIPAEELERMGIRNFTEQYPAWPHYEFMSSAGLVKDFKNLFAENVAEGATGSRFVTILMALAMPGSRGSVTLRSSDSSDLPIVNPAWLTSEVDQKVAVYAFKRARQVFQQEPLRRLLLDNGTEYFPGPSIQTDGDILDNFRQTAMTVWHAACTCAMRRRDYGGVLDNRLRVYDVDSLRVVDASSFPRLLPGHPTSVLYMLAERAATLIKEDNP